LAAIVRGTRTGDCPPRPVRGTPLALLQERVLPFLSKQKGKTVGDERLELPQGTLDLLILRTLALGPQHGWAVSERIQQISSDVLQVQQGSLYPSLHRLERRGLIKARWGASDNNRKAKFYELTAAGRKQLEADARSWRKLAGAIAQVLDMA
jgi:PadR family transcriptional regulator PadR